MLFANSDINRAPPRYVVTGSTPQTRESEKTGDIWGLETVNSRSRTKKEKIAIAAEDAVQKKQGYDRAQPSHFTVYLVSLHLQSNLVTER